MEVSPAQALAFRLAAQGLGERAAGPAAAPAALSTWAVQDSPPGAAALALHARADDGLDAGWLDGALLDSRTAVALYNPRTATAILPAAEVGAFTRGLLPPDEAALRFVLGRAVPPEGQGTAPDEAVRLTVAVIEQALDGRALSRDALHQALRDGLPGDLVPWCEGCGSHHARRGLLVAAGLHGRLCIAGRAGRQPAFARTDQWLADGATGGGGASSSGGGGASSSGGGGASGGISGGSSSAGEAVKAPTGDVGAAAAEVVRRFLRGYGPSTRQQFAQWAGISPAHARRSWGLVEDELAAVEIAGDDGAPMIAAHVLTADVDHLDDPPPVTGVRLLSPGDPLLLARDRELLIPDPAVRRRVWRAINGPGVVLADGAPVALWRGRKRGRRLEVALEPLVKLTRRRLAAIEEEARAVAPHRGCGTAAVGVDGGG
jgi:uncharacterized membrane protein YgcG